MITQAYISKKDFKNALINSKYLLNAAYKSANLNKVKDANFFLSEIYEKLNDNLKALYYFKLGTRLKDSLVNSDKIIQISNLETNFKIENKEKENIILKKDNALKENENSKLTSIRNLLIVISVLVLLIALGFGNKFYFKKKQNLLLEEKNNLLKKANDEIDGFYNEKIQLQQESYEKESQIMQLKNEKLNAELELKHKELAALAINLVDKNEYLIKLKEQAESIGKVKPEEVGPLVRVIMRSINMNIRSEETWMVFETQFKAIHRGFMEFITAQYPELTVMEMKVCALLKINLSSKEISSMLNISVRTVEYHRLDIRKKLGIEKDVNLNQFIASLSYNE